MWDRQLKSNGIKYMGYRLGAHNWDQMKLEMNSEIKYGNVFI